jgi:Flp pilus assembly protein TadD
MVQSNAFRVGTVNSIQPKTHLAADSQFAREMESAAISEKLGDEDGAIDCCYRAALLSHSSQHDKSYFRSVIDGIEKKMPANPKVQIALGRYFETNEEFKTAEKAYRKAIELSPGHHNPIASNLLDSVLERVSLVRKQTY